VVPGIAGDVNVLMTFALPTVVPFTRMRINVDPPGLPDALVTR